MGKLAVLAVLLAAALCADRLWNEARMGRMAWRTIQNAGWAFKAGVERGVAPLR